MKLIRNIIEPNSLLLVWQPSEALDSARRRRVVGRLLRDRDSFSFEYVEGKDLDIARNLGFQAYGPFDDFNKRYTENVLDVFLRRLPPRTRKDYPRFLLSMRLDSSVPISDFALLGYSGAYLPSDSFSLVHTFEEVEGNCQLLQNIAGFRYYINNENGGAIFMDLALGDPVELIAEPENPYDPNAVKIELSGKMIGHINRFIAPSINKWLRTRSVTSHIEKVTGTVDNPIVSIYIDVE